MSSYAAEGPLPAFYLLTGFLGSGKTTLLQEFLADPSNARTGVIVNDVGQLNIDGALISSRNSDLQVLQLTNGCVCCSLMGDLPATIAALFDDNEARGNPPFERIVLETSGLSRPGSIIKSLLGFPVPFRVTVLTTYDLRRGSLGSDHFPEAAAQVAAAATVVLTKLDLVDDDAVEAARASIAALNPFAKLLIERDPAARARQAFAAREADPRSLLRRLGNGFLEGSRVAAGASHRARVLLARFREEVGAEELIEWLENLTGFCGDRLLRSKGLVRVAASDHRLLVQSVGTAFDVPRLVSADPSLDSAVVVIVHSLALADLQAIPGAVTPEWRELQVQGEPQWPPLAATTSYE